MIATSTTSNTNTNTNSNLFNKLPTHYARPHSTVLLPPTVLDIAVKYTFYLVEHFSSQFYDDDDDDDDDDDNDDNDGNDDDDDDDNVGDDDDDDDDDTYRHLIFFIKYVYFGPFL